jgi:hypothetical protein
MAIPVYPSDLTDAEWAVLAPLIPATYRSHPSSLRLASEVTQAIAGDPNIWMM